MDGMEQSIIDWAFEGGMPPPARVRAQQLATQRPPMGQPQQPLPQQPPQQQPPQTPNIQQLAQGGMQQPQQPPMPTGQPQRALPQAVQRAQQPPQPQGPSALPRATNRQPPGESTGQITSGVTADAQQYSDLQRQRRDLEQQQIESMKPVDYSGYDETVKKRNRSSTDEMLNALGAKEAGLDAFTGMHLQQAAKARENMKVTGGIITADGFVKDFGHEEELQAKRLDARIKQIDTLLNENLTRQQRADLQRERLQAENAMKEMMAGVQRAIAAQASGDRRYAADLAHQDRQAAAAAKGTDPKYTGEERGAQGYLSRMRAAESVLSRPELAGAHKPEFWREALPGAVGGKGVANVTRSKERQLADQAQKDWVRAKLRKESGAVIGPEEMAEEIRTYFPQIGDDDATVAQKRESRLEAERQLEIMGAVDSKGDLTGHRPSQPAQQLPRISGDADFNALPSGTEFIGPDGKKRRKP